MTSDPTTDQPTPEPEEGGDIEQRIDAALDSIDAAVEDLRSLIESAPVRGLAEDVKAAAQQFISQVNEALDTARDLIDASSGSEPEEG